MIVFFDEGMLSTNGYIVDPDIGLMASSQLYFVNIVEVYDMKLLLLLVVVFWRIYLKRLDDHVILFGFNYLENLISLVSMPIRVFQL